jgi:hypothetical protein
MPNSKQQFGGLMFVCILGGKISTSMQYQIATKQSFLDSTGKVNWGVVI